MEQKNDAKFRGLFVCCAASIWNQRESNPKPSAKLPSGRPLQWTAAHRRQRCDMRWRKQQKALPWYQYIVCRCSPPRVCKPGHLAARHRSHSVLKESRRETARVVRALRCAEPVAGSCYVFSVKTLMGEQAPCRKRPDPTGNQASSCLLPGWVWVTAALPATP